MKSRHFTAIALSILSLCVLPSCDKSVAVTGIKLDKTSLSLTEGESANLTATIEPSNATNGTVTWSSTDATIASVNNGLVKALTAGSTTVKVTTADGAKTAECAVTVNKKIIAVTGVILDFVSDTLIVNQTKQLTAIVKPDDASDKT
ncbi:MAG: Ig-like domain-containing protein, partial [Bacteroidales bacterium]